VSEPDPSQDCYRDRWLPILDRIEHRQSHIGLRFWGPPLWLEVTMQGPDSDLWPAITNEDQEWNWQSSAPCAGVSGLAGDDGDAKHLLTAIGRYTVENLILNAVHEIGEWLRFDGQRLFPTHLSHVAPLGVGDEQGNGAVQLEMTSVRRSEFPSVLAHRPSVNEPMAEALVRRLAKCAAGPRFTHLPDTTICFETAGPVIRRRGGGASTVWRSAWSTSTIQAACAPMEELIEVVGQDVHRALVFSEADRICRAFHVDGQRRWRLRTPMPPLGDEQDDESDQAEVLDISVSYSSRWRELGIEHTAVLTAPKRQHRCLT
jgi:hypothetical protein